jgi:hypothetical protein
MRQGIWWRNRRKNVSKAFSLAHAVRQALHERRGNYYGPDASLMADLLDKLVERGALSPKDVAEVLGKDFSVALEGIPETETGNV